MDELLDTTGEDTGGTRRLRALVIGGGIAGIQAALVEKSPTLGGRMAQLDKTFPTMDCAI